MPYKHLQESFLRLEEITKECRLDMHEPNEAGVNASVVGYDLDNAMGHRIKSVAIEKGYQELIVIIRNEHTDKTERINLATLIALARLADKQYLESLINPTPKKTKV